MRNYFWKEFSARPLSARFPDWTIGRHLWLERNEDNPEAMLALLDELVEYRRHANWGTSPLECPRLFISHRQKDEIRAREIAGIAQKVGFQYWLDVLDPDLLSIAATATPTPQQSLRLAVLIEVALVNSTHILALMTANTKGSMWVPYEYGRAKDSSPNSLSAAYWIDAGLEQQLQRTGEQLPEYLLLSLRTERDVDIERWLLDELVSWQTRYGACPTGQIVLDSGVDPGPQGQFSGTLSESAARAIDDEYRDGLTRPITIRPPLRLRKESDRP